MTAASAYSYVEKSSGCIVTIALTIVVFHSGWRAAFMVINAAGRATLRLKKSYIFQ